MAEKLILTPFKKALESLEAVLAVPKDDIVRDATIQRFEYTYELAWKMIKRHLEWAGAEADSLTRKSLFREAARIGVIADAEPWFDYNEARDLTSHTYDEVRAEEVYEMARRFAVDARRLLEALKQHHG
ncbi:MAG TPA: nucleotidyltransferase substrate binding protein [Thermoanaerobaculia bacterium]|nr:nucleotidyltransferase substrate binding protein [Thermoanaerobaculia bacterium]